MHNAHIGLHGEGFAVGTQWKKKITCKLDRRNTRNPEDNVARRLSCRAKQRAAEGSDLQGRGKQEATGRSSDSKDRVGLTKTIQ
jgi:hypothetical protein